MPDKTIKKWEPDDFELEMTSVWSFPNRGNWATHDAKWRGNWSPYIPRNILLRYSSEGQDIPADLSNFKVDEFLTQMKAVASESYRVLKEGKFCAVLMGDMRQKGHVIPLGFRTMQVFEDAGFKLKEIIMKEQHNCRATGYWKTNSVKYNFLLLAHEYLFIFRKD